MEKKVVIAGAGPAGLAAAIVLAKAGKEVEVYEKAPVLGSRFGSSYQAIENYTEQWDCLGEISEFGIQINFFAKPCTEMVLFDHRGSRHEVRSNVPYWYLVRRGTEHTALDASLARQAREHGARVHYGKAIGIKDADIIATGPRRGDGIAMECDAHCHEEGVFVLIDEKIAPGGYAYLHSYGGKGTCGVAITKSFGNLNRHFEDTCRFFRENIGANYQVGTRVAGVNFFVPKTAVKDGKIYCGEAAGFQDYFFGLGIRYAIVSGALAAESIIHERDYDSMWKARFGEKMRQNIANRIFYERAGSMGRKALLALASQIGIREFLLEWHKPRMFKRIVTDIFGRHKHIDQV
jgi:flavin-dependent dehydrogenase